MEALTISQLERETGVKRGTIYFYIRSGLLPPAQKSSATRAVYDQSHVELLHDIRRLRNGGRSLAQIREELSPRIASAAEKDVDLVARQNEETRRAILQAAAQCFARHGYEKTRIVDICRKVGVTTQVLYSHFPSKRHLFIACYNVYYQWMRDQITPHMDAVDDIAARMAWRVLASYSIEALSPDLQALARLEAINSESELRDLLRETYTQMLSEVEEDLQATRDPTANVGLFDDELVAYAMLGALENMQMRASWDDKYNRLDVMRNLLVIYMAVRAAYSGRVDLTREWGAVARLAERLAESTPGEPRTRGPGANEKEGTKEDQADGDHNRPRRRQAS